MKSSIAAVAGLVAIASAQSFTPPKDQTYGALNSPSTSSPVTTGQQFTVRWTPLQPAAGVKVSLVLCSGPSSNCVLQNTAIASGLDAAAGSYTWNVPCSLPAVASSSTTGNGMLIIVDGTGQFQYSTQFDVVAGSSCGSSGSSSTTTTTSAKVMTTTTSASGKPTSYTTTQGYYGWSTAGNSTTAAPQTWQATTRYTTAPATTTAAVVTAKPSTFTGAAALPTAFMNAVGVMGAAGLAMLAL